MKHREIKKPKSNLNDRWSNDIDGGLVGRSVHSLKDSQNQIPLSSNKAKVLSRNVHERRDKSWESLSFNEEIKTSLLPVPNHKEATGSSSGLSYGQKNGEHRLFGRKGGADGTVVERVDPNAQ